MTRISCYK